METKCYNTTNFLDSFEIDWSTGVEKYCVPHERIEECLLIFEANIKEHASLLEFAYACAHEQYSIEKAFARVIYKRGRHPAPHPPYIPWEYYKQTFVEFSITKEIFATKCNFCIGGLNKELKCDFDVTSAMILKDEWNSIFIVGECKNKYVGYWWKANF